MLDTLIFILYNCSSNSIETIVEILNLFGLKRLIRGIVIIIIVVIIKEIFIFVIYV